MSLSTDDGLRPAATESLLTMRAKLEARQPVRMDGPDVQAWRIDKKRLLTWYADPATFRQNPQWLARTGSDRWHDTGGYWIDHYGELRQGGQQRIRFELTGEGPDFFDAMYRKPAATPSSGPATGQ